MADNSHPPLFNSEITLRKSAENALGEAEKIFQLLVDAVTDYAIFALDVNGNILTWNRGAERLKGYKAHEIIGQHFSKFYEQKDIDRKHPQFELSKALSEGKFEEEGWRLKKDGQKFWASVVINRLEDEKGNFIGFSKVTRDLTERKKAEELLKESQERYRLLIDGVKDYAIIFLDPAGYVTSWNSGAEKIKQYTSQEIIGSHFSKFYPKSEILLNKPQRELEIAINEGRFEEEGLRLKKDGTTFWANVVLTPIRDDKNFIRGFAKITRDISEKKKASEKLKAKEDSLQELNENLEKKVAERTSELMTLMRELEAAIRARESFLSIASHELKTPLTSLKMRTQMRMRSFEKNIETTYGARELIEMSKDDTLQINRLTRLVDDILDTTRIDAGKLGLQLELVDLVSLIKGITESIAPQLQASHCKLTFTCHEKIEGFWDSYRLEQVLMNLLTNAMRYGAGKSINVTASTKDDWASFSVEDHGIGILPADQERIFQQFERATTLNEGKGLGLGLYIVRQIVESHGGKIILKSKPGKGSTFTVVLPL